MASAGEGAPSGLAGQAAMMGPGVSEESPETRRQRGPRALSIAARLLAGAATFFFLAFLFAYFYLRSINADHMWRPAHINPDQGLGAAFAACLIVSVGLTVLAGRRQQRSGDWLAPAIGALGLGLVAIALQGVEYTTQNFGPTNGAYASVFCAWSGFYLIAVLGTMYWLEIQVATELRERREPTARGGEGTVVYEHPDRLLPRGMEASVFFWTFLGGIGLLTYVVLYLL
jgi:heme/copper-type cytochrome/quinol oxidase subunit 3